MTALEDFTAATFSPHVGEVFRLHADAVVLDVELINVDELGESSPGRAPFSLLFRGPAEPILPQRIYRFEHDAIGEFDIFIVPIGFDETGGLRYEVVFA
ncbi:MAG: hypothetical protein QOE36_1651 [Gaiellaceae bacterium]|nr:hypothetical protein [Gaiellaceae bacterium]